MRRGSVLMSALLVLGWAAPLRAEQGMTAAPVLKGASTTLSGQPIAYLRTDRPEITSWSVEIAPGGEAGRHMHQVPTYVHVLEGTLTVALDDGTRHEVKAGQAFLEVTNTWHNGLNLTAAPVKFLVVFMGEAGRPNTVRPAASASGSTSQK